MAQEQVLQEPVSEEPKTGPAVSIGPASKTGWAASAVFFLGAIVDGIGNSQSAIQSQSKWLAILGAAVLVATNVMRQVQAHGLITAGSKGAAIVEAAEDTLTDVFDQVTEGMKAQAQANVPVATVESPDNVDHAGVPQSGAASTKQ